MKNLNFWLKKIDPSFLDLDEVPLIRGDFFSFEDLSAYLKEALELKKCEITSINRTWQTKEEIFQTFSKDVSQLCFTFTPLMGNAYFLMKNDDIKNLTSNVLSKKLDSNFSSFVLNEGFYRFINLVVLKHLQTTSNFKNLSAKIVENVEIKASEFFCIDLKIKIENKTIFGKILLTVDFRKSWNQFFNLKNSMFFNKMKNNIELPLQLIGGYSFLKPQELKNIKKGDFIILDKCLVSINGESSKALLSLNDNALFHTKIKKNKLYILDYANYYEENTMEEENNLEKENINVETPPLEEHKNVNTEVSPISEKTTPLNETEIKLTAELGKISIQLDKLMQIQPGNILHLPFSLEHPVNLTINGKKVGKGELIHLGEVLGIRILEI